MRDAAVADVQGTSAAMKVFARRGVAGKRAVVEMECSVKNRNSAAATYSTVDAVAAECALIYGERARGENQGAALGITEVAVDGTSMNRCRQCPVAADGEGAAGGLAADGCVVFEGAVCNREYCVACDLRRQRRTVVAAGIASEVTFGNVQDRSLQALNADGASPKRCRVVGES